MDLRNWLGGFATRAVENHLRADSFIESNFSRLSACLMDADRATEERSPRLGRRSDAEFFAAQCRPTTDSIVALGGDQIGYNEAIKLIHEMEPKCDPRDLLSLILMLYLSSKGLAEATRRNAVRGSGRNKFRRSGLSDSSASWERIDARTHEAIRARLPAQGHRLLAAQMPGTLGRSGLGRP